MTIIKYLSQSFVFGALLAVYSTALSADTGSLTRNERQLEHLGALERHSTSNQIVARIAEIGSQCRYEKNGARQSISCRNDLGSTICEIRRDPYFDVPYPSRTYFDLSNVSIYTQSDVSVLIRCKQGRCMREANLNNTARPHVSLTQTVVSFDRSPCSKAYGRALYSVTRN